MEEDKTFLGKGWSFPPAFENNKNEVLMVSEETDIAQSLDILLSTRPGERVMQPSFGCNLDKMLFEPITTSLITLMKDIIQTAILYHEPRIETKRIQINTEEYLNGLILIELDYVVRSSNSRFNLVYPFYIEEGTDVNISLQLTQTFT